MAKRGTTTNATTSTDDIDGADAGKVKVMSCDLPAAVLANANKAQKALKKKGPYTSKVTLVSHDEEREKGNNDIVLLSHGREKGGCIQ